ncbi:hypothetical protein LguiA_025196 [Lonicera macranthoides]
MAQKQDSKANFLVRGEEEVFTNSGDTVTMYELKRRVTPFTTLLTKKPTSSVRKAEHSQYNDTTY